MSSSNYNKMIENLESKIEKQNKILDGLKLLRDVYLHTNNHVISPELLIKINDYFGHDESE